MSLFGSIFLGASSAYAQAIFMAELQVIKAKKSPEFYSELLKTGDHFFALLEEATKNKVVNTVAETFKQPIEQTAKDDGIIL